VQNTQHEPTPPGKAGPEVKNGRKMTQVEKTPHLRDTNDRGRQQESNEREMSNPTNQTKEKLDKAQQHHNGQLEDREKHRETERREMLEKLEKMQQHIGNLEDHEQHSEKEKQEMTEKLEKIQDRNRYLEEREKEMQEMAKKLEKTQHRNAYLEDREQHREKERQEMTEKLDQLQNHIRRIEDHEQQSEKERQEMAKKLESMQHHNKHLEDRERRSEKEKQDMAENFKKMQHRNRSLEDRREDMVEKLEKLQHRNRTLEDREKHREKEKRELMDQVNQMAEKLEYGQRHNKSLEDHNHRQYEELRITSNQLRAAETQHQETRQALDVKVSELKGAQTFLTKEDSLSGAEVITMVNALNAEILQISAFIADSLDSRDRSITDEMASEGGAAREQAIRRIGEPLVQTLTTNFLREALDPDPLPLQIAMQIALARSCAETIQSWTPGFEQYESMLATIYLHLQETGQLYSCSHETKTDCWPRGTIRVS
jgi:chromosome segregation ATPase